VRKNVNLLKDARDSPESKISAAVYTRLMSVTNANSTPNLSSDAVVTPEFHQQTFTTKITTSMERTYVVADRYLLLGMVSLPS
jgi:hypothetical protein